MTQDQYTKEIEAIETQTKKLKWQVSLKYAKANQKYNIGDIIKCHYAIIEIRKVLYGFGFGNKLPEAHYRGVKLTIKLVPYKTDEMESIQQSSIIEQLFRKIKK